MIHQNNNSNINQTLKVQLPNNLQQISTSPSLQNPWLKFQFTCGKQSLATLFIINSCSHLTKQEKNQPQRFKNHHALESQNGKSHQGVALMTVNLSTLWRLQRKNLQAQPTSNPAKVSRQITLLRQMNQDRFCVKHLPCKGQASIILIMSRRFMIYNSRLKKRHLK